MSVQIILTLNDVALLGTVQRSMSSHSSGNSVLWCNKEAWRLW